MQFERNDGDGVKKQEDSPLISHCVRSRQELCCRFHTPSTLEFANHEKLGPFDP